MYNVDDAQKEFALTDQFITTVDGLVDVRTILGQDALTGLSNNDKEMNYRFTATGYSSYDLAIHGTVGDIPSTDQQVVTYDATQLFTNPCTNGSIELLSLKCIGLSNCIEWDDSSLDANKEYFIGDNRILPSHGTFYI